MSPRTFPSRPGEVFRPELDKLKLIPPGAGSAPGLPVSVRYSDVDGNGHVNNTAYFDLLQTALARNGFPTRPQIVEIQFLKEIPPEAESVDVRLEARGPAIAFSMAGPDALFAQGLVSRPRSGATPRQTRASRLPGNRGGGCRHSVRHQPRPRGSPRPFPPP